MPWRTSKVFHGFSKANHVHHIQNVVITYCFAPSEIGYDNQRCHGRSGQTGHRNSARRCPCRGSSDVPSASRWHSANPTVGQRTTVHTFPAGTVRIGNVRYTTEQRYAFLTHHNKWKLIQYFSFRYQNVYSIRPDRCGLCQLLDRWAEQTSHRQGPGGGARQEACRSRHSVHRWNEVLPSQGCHGRG